MVLEVESGRARTDLQDLATDRSDTPLLPGRPPPGRDDPGRGRSLASDLVLCDLQTGRPVATEHLPSALGSLPALAFSPDGRLLILASSERPRLPGSRAAHRPSPAARPASAPPVRRDLAVRPSDGASPHDRRPGQRPRVAFAVGPAGFARRRPCPRAEPATAALAAGGRELIAREGSGTTRIGLRSSPSTTWRPARSSASSRGGCRALLHARTVSTSVRDQHAGFPAGPVRLARRTASTSTTSRSGTPLPASGC